MALCFQVEQTLMPYLTVMAEFRENIRGLARTLKATEILKECDRLRDETLPNIGVRLEDQDEGMLNEHQFRRHF